MNNKIKNFFNELYKDTEGLIEIRLLEDRKSGKFITRRFFPSVPELLNSLESLKHRGESHNYPGGLYFGISTRKRESGKKEDISQVPSFWCDLDSKDFNNGKMEIEKLIDKFLLPPTCIIDSGHGFHLYWFLKEPECIESQENVTRIEGYLHGISETLNGDCVQNIDRLLRVPGTLNYKDLKNPVECKILKFNPELRYNPSDFDMFYKERSSTILDSVVLPNDVPEVNLEDLNITQDTKDLILKGWTPEIKDRYPSRSELDQSVITKLLNWGHDTGIIKSIFTNPEFGISGKCLEKGESGDSYLRNSISKGKRFLNPTIQEVYEIFKKWLYIEESELSVIDVVLGTIISHQLQGDPVWLFLVAPPGGMKTELIRSISNYHKVYTVSTLTEHSLISGKQEKNKPDPSLLPKINEKILVIKDFTTILTLRSETKTVIIGQLRDSFDGRCEKAFGNIGTKGYMSRFGLIAAVTPMIDKCHSIDQELGERLLKFRHRVSDSRKSIKQSQNNIGKEKVMREELSDIVNRFLASHSVCDIKIPDNIKDKIISLSDFVSKVRTSVSRHWKDETVEYKPVSEVGTRLVKQLTKLGMGLCIVRGKKEMTNEEYKLIRRIGEDTLPSKLMDIINTLYKEIVFKTTQEIGTGSGFPTDTVRKTLEDMRVLGVVERDEEKKNLFRWKMSDSIRSLMNEYRDCDNEIPF